MNKMKRGLSPIIASVLLVLLVFVLVAVVWTTYKGIVNRNLNKAESCLDTVGKIEIVGRYTCYDQNASHPQFQFSIERKDVNIDEIIVSLSSISGNKNFNLKNNTQTITGLRIYPDVYNIRMPEKNSAITYIVNLTAVGFTKPDGIKIAPIANGEQCEVVDTLNEIDNCIIPVPSGGGFPV